MSQHKIFWYIRTPPYCSAWLLTTETQCTGTNIMRCQEAAKLLDWDYDYRKALHSNWFIIIIWLWLSSFKESYDSQLMHNPIQSVSSRDTQEAVTEVWCTIRHQLNQEANLKSKKERQIYCSVSSPLVNTTYSQDLWNWWMNFG